MESAEREAQDEEIAVAAETPSARQMFHNRKTHPHSQVNSIGVNSVSPLLLIPRLP